MKKRKKKIRSRKIRGGKIEEDYVESSTFKKEIPGEEAELEPSSSL